MGKEDVQSHHLLRVFADPSKLKLLAAICDEPLPLHTLARTAGLSETEAMRQIGGLKEAGLLSEVFAHDGFRWQYQPNALFEALAVLKNEAKPAGLSEEWTAEEAKVLGDFFVNNRLKTIPAQRKKKDIVVRYLAQQFEYGKTYTEQEVNFKLLDFHEDYATLRREMIDTKLMRRENGIYQRLTAAAGAV
jgi:hypothetical protein